LCFVFFFFFSSRRRHTSLSRDWSSDVCSSDLVVLYEMLTGRRPFLGAYPPAVIYSILNEDRPPLRDVNPEIDPELETIMLRALEKNVDRRYHSAGEMLQALRSYHDATTSRSEEHTS